MTPIRLSVIVSTTGGRSSLDACLRALRASLERLAEAWELLVVHNASEASGELRAVCASLGAGYIHEPIRGLSVARNRGVCAARGEVVAFVDDDILVAPGWAANLCRHFEEQNLEAVTGPVLAAPGANPAGLDWAAIYAARPSVPTVFDARTNVPFFPLTAGICGTGGNMAFRTGFLLRHGLFDPRFGLGTLLPGGEEVDRFYAVLRQGGRILFAPDVCVEHVYSGDRQALHSKIAGYAAAQLGFFLKCFLGDPAMRWLVVRYVAHRVLAVLKPAPGAEPAHQARAPRWRIIRGSLWGPFAYLLSALREGLWPVRGVVAPLPTRECAEPASPRVLILLHNSDLGGAERIARDLATALHERMPVAVVAPEAGQTTAALHAAGVAIGFVPRRRLRATLNPVRHVSYLARLPGTVAAYRRVIRAWAPDVVHVDSLMNLPALLAARLCGAGTLLHLQEIPAGMRKPVAWLAGRLAHRIVAVSHACAAPLRRGVNAGKLAVVYNGTGFSAPALSPPPGGWVTFVGRLSEDKDPIAFVRAASQVHAQEPEARFMICGVSVPGRARYEAALRTAMEASGIPNDLLQMTRDREDVADLLRQSAILVSCSAAEPFGLAVIEAMALGIPAVLPNSGAFPELFRHEETALLYSPGNIAEMASCILRFLREPQLAERIGRGGHESVRARFGLEGMVRAMEWEYRRLND